MLSAFFFFAVIRYENVERFSLKLVVPEALFTRTLTATGRRVNTCHRIPACSVTGGH